MSMGKKRQVIRVVPNGSGGWDVQDGKRVVSHHRKKETAVDRGRSEAKKQKPSELVIHKKNGKIQTEHTYEQDPYPPPG